MKKRPILTAVLLLTAFIAVGQTKKANSEAIYSYQDCKQLSSDTSYFQEGQMAMMGICTKCLTSHGTSNVWLPVRPGETQSRQAEPEHRYSEWIIKNDTVTLFIIPNKLKACSYWEMIELASGDTVTRLEFDKGSFWSGAVVHNRLFFLKNNIIQEGVGKDTSSTKLLTLFVYLLVLAGFYFLFGKLFMKILFNTFLRVNTGKKYRYLIVNVFFMALIIFALFCIAIFAAVICDLDRIFITNPYFWVNDILIYFLIFFTVILVNCYRVGRKQLVKVI